MIDCGERRLVHRHFAGENRPADEAKMRVHLPDCASCRDFYRRHRLLAELDPKALRPIERLGRGLGLTVKRPSRAFAPFMLFAVATSILLVLLPRSPSDSIGTRFAARGAPSSAASLHVYPIASARTPSRNGDVIAPRSELAFAYDNRGGFRHLMIFAMDEHRHVYWYYPAWTNPSETPLSIDIAPGAHELPDAVSHDIDGIHLELVSLFSNQPFNVRDIEAKIVQGEIILPPDAVEQRLRLEIRP